MNTEGMKPIILCAGQNGRALVYGYVTAEPEPGRPVELRHARMVIYYPSGGTFGLAASGPPDGSRISARIEVTVETVWQEWMAVSEAAAGKFDA